MMRKFLTAGLLLCVSVAMWATPQAGKGRYDQQIQQDVTKALQSKDKWKGITATTEDAIVTLQGNAKLLIDKLDAGKKVDKIDHVAGVRNHVDVAGNVPDEKLQQQISDKLRYDRVGLGNTFNAFGLQVQNGVVTLSGDVRDYPARDSALSIVETTPGVKDVVDNVNVLPTSPMDDDIRIRVARAIYGNPSLSRYGTDPQRPIRIVVENGHVTLYGVVDTQGDKTLAAMQARSVPNVFSVDDKLMVASNTTK
jgi:hyperosmotically inducible periplasmic protein